MVAENSQEPPAVFSQTPAHHQSSLHPRSTELRSGLDVSCGSLPQRMEVEYCTCADVVEQIWEVDFIASQDNAQYLTHDWKCLERLGVHSIQRARVSFTTVCFGGKLFSFQH